MCLQGCWRWQDEPVCGKLKTDDDDDDEDEDDDDEEGGCCARRERMGEIREGMSSVGGGGGERLSSCQVGSSFSNANPNLYSRNLKK